MTNKIDHVFEKEKNIRRMIIKAPLLDLTQWKSISGTKQISFTVFFFQSLTVSFQSLRLGSDCASVPLSFVIVHC